MKSFAGAQFVTIMALMLQIQILDSQLISQMAIQTQLLLHTSTQMASLDRA